MPDIGITDSLILRALAGALVAGIVAALARRAGALSVGGRWAAFATGTLVAAAGWRWALLLIGYFVLSSLLTRAGADAKAQRAAPILPDQRERNALQVLANGGLFAIAMLAGELLGDQRLMIAGLGALGAAAADTWATEIGLLWGGAPRSILSGRVLAAGESGGITMAGTAAGIVAAALVALTGASLLGAPDRSIAIALLVAGIAGSLADSLLGASLQSKRWCEHCRTWTERRVHTCQYRTQHARGLRWMTNDAVNFLATVIGAIVALAVAASR
jgi:uncharacterized protein (TIGR00297 family)